MADRPSERSGEPLVAVLLSWFLPGAGHVYVGRIGVGVLAFLLVEGLFAAGLLLTDGRTFEFLDPELRGVMATALTPEAGNLGGLIWQLRNHGFGGTEPGPFPPHMMAGVWLCALSGMVNACFLVHVHVSARTPRTFRGAAPHPAWMVALAWLVPGLGHLAQRRVLRGAIVFALLVGLLAWGTWLADASNLSRQRHFYYWSGQFLAGLPALVTEFASGRPPVTQELRWGDVGLLYACMAGLLNVLAMLDVYAVAERRYLAQPPAAAAPSPAPGPEAA
jgi:hypothetical protein